MKAWVATSWSVGSADYCKRHELLVNDSLTCMGKAFCLATFAEHALFVR